MLTPSILPCSQFCQLHFLMCLVLHYLQPQRGIHCLLAPFDSLLMPFDLTVIKFLITAVDGDRLSIVSVKCT